MDRLAEGIRRIQGQDIDDLLGKVKKEYNRVVRIKDNYKKQLDSYSKDEEVIKVNEEIRYVREHSLCELSDKSLTDLKKFRNAHYIKCKNGSKFTYEICSTGIGDVITVRCPICGEEMDITDCTAW